MGELGSGFVSVESLHFTRAPAPTASVAVTLEQSQHGEKEAEMRQEKRALKVCEAPLHQS